jgi:hypothetical protein
LRFISRLEIREGAEYKVQQAAAISALAEGLGGSILDVQDLHYGNALALVQELAMKRNVEDRKIKRPDFIARLDKRTLLYDRWHQEVVGLDLYMASVARRIKTGGQLKVIRQRGLVLSTSLTTDKIASLIVHLGHRQYGVGKMHTAKPWTVILLGPPEEVRDIKTELLQRNVRFDDGYEELTFQPEMFGRLPIVNTNGASAIIAKTSYDVRVVGISSFEAFVQSGRRLDVIVVTTAETLPVYTTGSSDIPITIGGISADNIRKVLEMSA